jgi:diguanylate cyclase (GGDEF)-like protein
MLTAMFSVIDCMRHMHDGRLVALAGVVCAIGIYASFAIAQHATRATGTLRTRWGLVSVVASGCTAWATHFIVLLGFRPGMPAAFEPALTAISLLAAIVGIGAGVAISLRSARRRGRQFLGGLVVGLGVSVLHYVGQAAYVVQGTVQWQLSLVFYSIMISLPLSGLAIIAVSNRDFRTRRCGAPLLLLSIAILHFSGMAAMTLHFDPSVALPADAVSPEAITPVVAGVSLALLALAIMGWRFDLSAKERQRRDGRRLRALADVALEGLLICQGDVVVTANNSIERLSGHGATALSGSFVSALLPGLDIASLPEREERDAQLMNAQGQLVPVRVLRSEVALGHKLQTVIAVRDQRERLRTEAKMQKLAFDDSLTSLPNRTRFFDLLAVHAASRRERDRTFAVLTLNLDRFKKVNDALGHASGDIILRLVADRLQVVLRDEDIVARLGGDEFVILQLSIDGAESAETLAARIVESFETRPFLLDGQSVQLGISIGIALAPEDGDDPAVLLRNADIALHAAKADGKGTIRRYDVSLDEKMQERRAMEAGLRNALSDDQLELYYQPLVDTKTGDITSVEALVRWHHPEMGMIPPSDFVALAEETGLILPLGEWVLRTACIEATNWPSDISVAVNLSPAQFRERSLVELVASALKAAQLPPGRLELEITEGTLLDDEERTLHTLAQLRSMGVRISMDDFGTGYSSLSYLRKFRFDKLKIDQSFVRQLPGDPESVAIVRAIITMSACLGIGTVVEGVETREQLEFSVAEGCDSIQGYYISCPLDRDGIALLIGRGMATERSAAVSAGGARTRVLSR